jgi:hypothetical protein
MLECIIRDDACIDMSQCTFENVLYDERNHRKLPKNEPSQNINLFVRMIEIDVLCIIIYGAFALYGFSNYGWESVT